MKALAIVAAAFALALSPAISAQEADSPNAANPVQAQGAEQSLTGCLSSHEDHFMLRTSSGEVKLEGSGLEAHVGKTIRVTGTSSSKPGDGIFKVSAVTVVSPQCQA